ncbi:MAG: tetratricopeptide repeat protein [Leptotrichiaceae bacterium]|jgi:Tfp pilus assembly protein PilF
MKKTILILILTIASLGFAGVKEDYEAAQKLAQDKKYDESIQALDKIAKGTDKEYAVRSNYQLGSYYGSKQDYATAKKYLLAAVSDSTNTTPEALESLYRLANVYFQEKDLTNAEKYLLEVNRRTLNKDPGYLTDLIVYYLETNQGTKADTKYKSVMQILEKEQITALNNNLGEYYITKNDFEKAQSYFSEALKNSTSNQVVETAYRLGQIAMTNNNKVEAEKYFIMMNDKTEWKDEGALKILGIFYLDTQNYDKAEETLKKAIVVNSKNLEARVLLLELYETKNDQNSVTRIIFEIKTIQPIAVNKNLGIYFAQAGNINLAEKYLRKAINEDKDNSSKVTLAIVYYNVGKIPEAKDLLNEASKNGVKEADEILQQIKEDEAKGNTTAK